MKIIIEDSKLKNPLLDNLKNKTPETFKDFNKQVHSLQNELKVIEKQEKNLDLIKNRIEYDLLKI